MRESLGISREEDEDEDDDEEEDEGDEDEDEYLFIKDILFCILIVLFMK